MNLDIKSTFVGFKSSEIQLMFPLNQSDLLKAADQHQNRCFLFNCFLHHSSVVSSFQSSQIAVFFCFFFSACHSLLPINQFHYRLAEILLSLSIFLQALAREEFKWINVLDHLMPL